MNTKHPIDDFFHSKLQDFEMEPPMHLWENIDKKRSFTYRLRKSRYLQMRLLTGILLLSILIAWQIRPKSINLGAFPIPAISSSQTAVTPQDSAEDAPVNNQTISAESEATTFSAIAPVKIIQDAVPPYSPKNQDLAFVAPAPAEKAALDPATTGTRNHAPKPLPENEIGALQYPLAAIEALPLAPIDRAPRKWQISAAVMAAPERAFRQLTPVNGASDAFIDARQAYETPWLSYTMGIELQAVSPSGLALATGIQYNRINEKFDYYNPAEKRFIVSDIKGPGAFLVGRDTTVISGQRWKTSHNYQSTLAIPLLLGYEKSHGKATFIIYGGPMIHIYNDYRKDLQNAESGYPVSISPETDNYLVASTRTRGQLSWQIRAGVQYDWKPGIQVFLAPQLRFSPGAGTTLNKEQYLVSGLSAGLKTRIY